MARQLLQLADLYGREAGSQRGLSWGRGAWAVVTHLSWGHSPILTLYGEALWGQSE